MKMDDSRYIYDLDDRPPLRNGLLYALQWAIIVFPALIIVATLASGALRLDSQGAVRFLQLTLLSSGILTA
ncbi:MAG: hypothetical protein ACLGPL_08920, partial [Acidobacteriota bacterium]